MNDAKFEEQVHHHLRLFTAPDYTAKGDAVNFFKAHHQRAIPILEKLAKTDKVAAQMLDVARSAAAPKKKSTTFMEDNPDLF